MTKEELRNAIQLDTDIEYAKAAIKQNEDLIDERDKGSVIVISTMEGRIKVILDRDWALEILVENKSRLEKMLANYKADFEKL